MPGGGGVPLIEELQPLDDAAPCAHEPQLWIGGDRRPFVAEHVPHNIGFPRLQHGQPCAGLGDMLEENLSNRGGLAPIAVRRFKDEGHPRVEADKAIGSQSNGMPLKALVADPLDVLFGDNPSRPADHGGIDDEEVGPGGVEHDTQVMGVDDLDGLDPRVQLLGREALVAPEAKLDVLRRARIAIVEGEPGAQRDVVDQPVRAFRPGGRQGGGHEIGRQGLEQRIMERVQKGQWGGPWPRGIEKRGRNRLASGDDELPLRRALRRSLSCEACHYYADEEPHGYISAHCRASLRASQSHVCENSCEHVGGTHGSGCRTLRLSRTRKLKRSVSCRVSAAGGCSALMPRQTTARTNPGMYDPGRRDCAWLSHPCPAHAIAPGAPDTLSITALLYGAGVGSPDAAALPRVTPRLPSPKWPHWSALWPNTRDWRAIGQSARQDNRHSGPSTHEESLVGLEESW